LGVRTEKAEEYALTVQYTLRVDFVGFPIGRRGVLDVRKWGFEKLKRYRDIQYFVDLI